MTTRKKAKARRQPGSGGKAKNTAAAFCCTTTSRVKRLRAVARSILKAVIVRAYLWNIITTSVADWLNDRIDEHADDYLQRERSPRLQALGEEGGAL